jgi:hypothetical protein
MGRFCSTGFAFTALTLAAGMHVTNPARAQNINDFLSIFRGDRQRAARQAQADWRRVPPAEMACINQRLGRKGSSVEALGRRGVKPSAARLIELRSSCRELVESIQTGTAPASTRAATSSPTPTVAASNQTEPKDAGVATPSSAESVAEEQVDQGSSVELKDNLPESGVLGWLSKAFPVAVIAIAALLGIVISLFIGWRRTGQRTVAVSLPGNNSEGGVERAPLETAIGAGEVVMPLADKMIQLPDQTWQGAAISMSQNSAYSNKIESTNEEVHPDLSTTDSNAVENVAQLAKLYAMGTPTGKELQRLRALVSQSLGDSSES